MGATKQAAMEQMEADLIADDLNYLGGRYGYEDEWQHGKCPSRQKCAWCGEEVKKDEHAYFVPIERPAEAMLVCHCTCVEDARAYDWAMDKDD